MFLKFLVLLFSLSSVVLAGNSPVFLWGFNSDNIPALKTLSEDEFGQIISPQLDSMVVAFLESELTNDDLSHCQSKNKESCYANLKGVSDKTYFPSVQNPVEALSRLTSKQQFVTINAEGILDNDVSYEAGKIVFVSLQAPTVPLDRSETLELHDAAIIAAYKQLASLGKTIGLYTSAESKSLSRHRRQATEESATYLRESNKFLIYFRNVTLKQDSEKPVHITLNTLKVDSTNASRLVVVLSGGTNSVTLTLIHSQSYFELIDLKVNNERYYVYPPVNALTDFSYYCGDKTFQSAVENSKNEITFQYLQFQAPFSANAADDFKFGDPWHCVGFFSPGILAGLFVVIMFLAIMAVGICWIMDINTMDRFDDPKGKTITINTSE